MEVFKVDNWKGGLNNNGDPTKIKDNELTKCINVEIKRDGNIKRRNGYERVYKSVDSQKEIPAARVQNIYQFWLNNEWWLLVIADGKVFKWNTKDKVWDNISDTLQFNTENKLGLIVYYGDILIIDKANGIYIYKNEVTFLDEVLYTVKENHIYIFGDSDFNAGNYIDIEISDTTESVIGKEIFNATNDVRLQGIYRSGNDIYLLDNLTRWRIIRLNILFEYQTEKDIEIAGDVVPNLVFLNDYIYILNSTTKYSKYERNTLAKIFTKTLTKSTHIITRSKRYSGIFMPVVDINGIFPNSSFYFGGYLNDFNLEVHSGFDQCDIVTYTAIYNVYLKGVNSNHIYAHRDFYHWGLSGHAKKNCSRSIDTSKFINEPLKLVVQGWQAFVQKSSGSFNNEWAIDKITLKIKDANGNIFDFSKQQTNLYTFNHSWTTHEMVKLKGYSQWEQYMGTYWTHYLYANTHYSCEDKPYWKDHDPDSNSFVLGFCASYEENSHFWYGDRYWNEYNRIWKEYNIKIKHLSLPTNLQWYLFRNDNNYFGYRYGADKNEIKQMKTRKYSSGEHITMIRDNNLKITDLKYVNLDIGTKTLTDPEKKFLISPEDDGNYMYFLKTDGLKTLKLDSGSIEAHPFIVDLTKFNGSNSGDRNDVGTGIFSSYFEKKKKFRFLGAPDVPAYETKSGGTLSGDKQYIITFIFQGNVESPASNPLIITGLSNNKIRLFNMLLPLYIQEKLQENPGYLIERRIYRSDDGINFKLLDTIDNNTTEYTDDGSTGLGTEYKMSSKKNYLFDTGKIYLNRLILMGNDIYDSMIFYSEVDVINDVPLSNFREINRNDGDNITAIEPLQGQLLIFKTNNIYSIIGDVEDGGFNHISKNIGCVHQNTVKSLKSVTFFLDRSGFYMTDGNQVIKISEKISRYFDKDYEEKINFNYISKSRVIIDNFASEVKWYLPTGVDKDGNDIDYINKVIIYNYELKLWREEFYSHQVTEAAVIEEDNNKIPAQVFGSNEGKLYKFTKINDDAGKRIQWEVITKAFTVGSNLYEKIFKKLFIVFDAQGSFDVGYSISLLEFYSDTVEAYGELYNKNKIIRIMNGRGTEIQVRVTGNSTSEQPVEIKEIQIYYLPLRSTGRGR